MKLKHLYTAAAITLFAACGTPYRATDSDTLVISSNAQAAFISQYPDVSNVVWSRYDPNVIVINDWEMTGWNTIDANDYVVRFDKDNENYYAWYDSDGTWIGSAYVLRDYSKLPTGINTTITNTYPGYTITSVNREYYKDRNLYEITMKKDDGKIVLLVDNDGNVVKSKMK